MKTIKKEVEIVAETPNKYIRFWAVILDKYILKMDSLNNHGESLTRSRIEKYIQFLQEVLEEIE